MFTIDRRTFLAGLAGSRLVGAGEAAQGSPQYQYPEASSMTPPAAGACWLDVAAPLVVVDPAQQLTSDLLLTATCFPGIDGYKDSHYSTEYEILLFDAAGKEIQLDRGGRLNIPALRPTLVSMKDLSHRDKFFGGAKIRLAPSANQVARAGDLFSAGFMRWDQIGRAHV